ncbi:hypothetical protein CEXT_45101 [Caerostris extrusa]|uniref:Uncharacterized protein n=1 Tax=Caerostris extrusa TaxID=172846 RepID=A0AAV4URY9_CAEEX|nr:hypothetical protein CEXT_45101 [Caerostris extrusa]
MANPPTTVPLAIYFKGFNITQGNTTTTTEHPYKRTPPWTTSRQAANEDPVQCKTSLITIAWAVRVILRFSCSNEFHRHNGGDGGGGGVVV